MTEKEPKKLGHPYTLKGGRALKVYLDTDTITLATRLGDGNLSAGIRKAVGLLNTLRQLPVTPVD
jgi:hypothetical protein